MIVADETLTERRLRLKVRLDAIHGEKRYGVWRGGEKEPAKLARAIARIDRKQKRGQA